MFKRSHLSCLFAGLACLAPQVQAQPLDAVFEDARAYIDPTFGDVYVEVRKRGYNVCSMAHEETSRIENFWTGKYLQDAQRPEVQAALREKFNEMRSVSWALSKELDAWMAKWNSVPESDFNEATRHGDLLGRFLIQAAVTRDLGFSNVRTYCQYDGEQRWVLIKNVEQQRGEAVPNIPQ